MTYKHVLKRVLGKPAIEKHGNEEMPQGWKEDLQRQVSVWVFEIKLGERDE